MTDSKIWSQEIRETAKTLISIPSISPDVDAENRCAEKILELIQRPFRDTSEIPDFNPVFWSTRDGRNSVACLIKSRNPNNTGRTIILMGHFDTVGVEDFGRFGNSNIAFQPDELAKAIKTNLDKKLQHGSLDGLEESAYQAVQSGEWMFGRGSLDMKSGVAINISVFREFASPRGNGARLIDELEGNLLFLACPDEETDSAGIVSAVPGLLKLRAREKLNYIGVINADYTSPRGADENERYIYSGTVGKLLPSFYILGVRTHVGEIFRGVDASHIAAELVSLIDLNPAWADGWRGSLGEESIAEIALPPVALHMRDLKPSYNVETAGEAFVYVNWLTLALTPGQAMTRMMEAAHKALEAVRVRRDESFQHFESQGGQAHPPPAWSGLVLDFETLLEQAVKGWETGNPQGRFSDWLRIKSTEFELLTQDGRQLSGMIVGELAKIAGVKGPAVIVFFSPPYYPSIPPRENEITLAIKSILQDIPAPIQFRGFYPYISDLSYMQLDDHVNIEPLMKNMPLFKLTKGSGKLHDLLDSDTLNDIRLLDCAVVNIGPFGRDAHGLYERVHEPYSFETVPQIIFETIRKALNVSP